MPSDFFQNAFFYRSLALDADKALELFLGSFWEWFTALSTWTLSIFCLIDFVPLKNSLHFSVQRSFGALNLGGFVSFTTISNTVWDYFSDKDIIDWSHIQWTHPWNLRSILEANIWLKTEFLGDMWCPTGVGTWVSLFSIWWHPVMRQQHQPSNNPYLYI